MKRILLIFGLSTFSLLGEKPTAAPPVVEVKGTPAPAPPATTALEVNEAFSDLQAAYIAFREMVMASREQKALDAAQSVYAAALARAQTAQGVPNDCQIKKGVWIKSSTNGPCLIPPKK